MLQVFSNVIANSIDAMRTGGRLRITTHAIERPDRAGVEVLIEDNGPGIPQENLDRIFDPFFTTKGEIGTGIGLWVTRQLLGKYEGDISISSNTKKNDHWTKVNIFIPFHRPAE
jgi:signal transduction histidine kinase